MTKRKSKYRINTKGKSYSFTDSPFYKLTTKKKLAHLLQIEIPDFKVLMENVGNYSVFTQVGKSGKKRVIEQPVDKLDQVHSRIASLVCRMTVPDYVHSGVKKRSYVSNAKLHISNDEVLTLDIKSYYQSTKFSAVFDFFHKRMLCSSDVSSILSSLCTFEGHIPTGSRVSMPLALWANMNMFEEIHSTASDHELLMSVYVDDLTLSGKKIPPDLWLNIKNIIKKHGHVMHPDKTSHYKKSDVKIVTGVAIKNGSMHIKNEQHKKIKEDLIQWIICRDNIVPKSLSDRLIGRLNALSVIEPWLKDKARSVKSYSSCKGGL